MWAPPDLLTLCNEVHGAPYGSGLIWSAQDRKRADLLFEQMSVALKPRIVLLLRDESADATATYVYVFFEPLAQVVVALSHTEKKVSMVAEMWHSNEAGFKRLIDRAESLLEHKETIEALLLCMRKLPEIIPAGGQ